MSEAAAAPAWLALVDVGVRVTDAAASLVPSARELPDFARALLARAGRAAEDEREHVLLDGVSLTIDGPGVVAVVGVEGSGKSSLVRVLARELAPTSGSVLLGGVDVFDAPRRARLDIRRALQVVLDDERGGLDDRMRVDRAFAGFQRALRLPREVPRDLLATVGLDAGVLSRTVASLPSGEAKRAALARALLADPRVIVVDEPTRGLDPFERATLIDAVYAVAATRAVLVATRDIAFARMTAQRVVVLDQGVVVESGAKRQVLTSPAHPRTLALLQAEPKPRTAARTTTPAG